MAERAEKEMSEAEVYAALAKTTGLSVEKIELVFGTLAKIVTRELTNKKVIARELRNKKVSVISLPGLINIQVIRVPPKPPRTMNNPRTGEPIQLPGKPSGVAVKCQVPKKLKDLITATSLNRKP